MDSGLSLTKSTAWLLTIWRTLINLVMMLWEKVILYIDNKETCLKPFFARASKLWRLKTNKKQKNWALRMAHLLVWTNINGNDKLDLPAYYCLNRWFRHLRNERSVILAKHCVDVLIVDANANAERDADRNDNTSELNHFVSANNRLGWYNK